jgi:hypothetical protein
MPINWDAVKTAAATAGCVTLVIEYAAKPRLEARKEHHLDMVRTRRALLAKLLDLSMAAQVIGAELPNAAGPDVHQSLREERERQYGRLRAGVTELYESLGKYVRVYRDPRQTDLINIVHAMYGVVLSTRNKRRQAELIIELARTAWRIFDHSWRRPLDFLRARSELKQQLSALQGRT